MHPINDRKLTDEVNTIITNFNSTTSTILRICKKLAPNQVELDSLQNIIKLAKDVDPLIIINRCKDKFWMHREYIINEDENFFLNNQFSSFIKDDENKSFIYSLINLIKSRYKTMSVGEKKQIWSLIKDLLKYVIEYKKSINDFTN
ncbi:MAG: hypothetical protein ACRCZI_01085 [Cetobacterium sp.]